MKVVRMRSYTQTLPLEQWKRISKLAQDQGVSVSEYVRNHAIHDFLEKLDQIEREREVPA
jgi:hypothetical protein